MPSKKSTSTSASAKKTSGKKAATKTTKTKSADSAKTSSPSKSASSTKVAAPSTTSSVEAQEEPVTTTASVPAESDVSSEPTLIQQIEADITSLSEKLVQFKTMYASVTSDLRKLQKNMTKHVRENRKNKKRKTVSGDKPKRAPSGFAKPALISNELCAFLNKPPNTEMARTEVTKYLTTYIKEHNLQDQANKRKILPDAKLKKLLNLSSSDEVTYFNLQKYMKVHFPKSKSALAASSSSV